MNKDLTEENKQLKAIIKEFFDILETKDESESGRPFNPVQITSCRVMLSARLKKVLAEMKEVVK